MGEGHPPSIPSKGLPMLVLVTRLWLPEESRDEIEPQQVRDFKKSPQGRYIYERLKSADARLDIIWIKKGATSFGVDERFAIVRYGDDGLAACWIVQTDRGEYCEPTDQHVNALFARDTAMSPRVMEAHKKAVERDRAEALIQREALRAEFRDKLNERLDHVYNPRISVPGEIPGPSTLARATQEQKLFAPKEPT